MARTKVAASDEIAVGGAKLVQGPEGPVAVFRTAEGYFAVDEMCPHRAGPLSEGKLEGTTIRCPWHDAVFDLRTGEALPGGITKRPVRRWRLVEEGGALWIET